MNLYPNNSGRNVLMKLPIKLKDTVNQNIYFSWNSYIEFSLSSIYRQNNIAVSFVATNFIKKIQLMINCLNCRNV